MQRPLPENHIDQYDLEFPKPEGIRLLTPDEIYAKGDAQLLAFIKEDCRIEKKPVTYPCRALSEYFSMWANTPPDGGLIVIGMENDGSIVRGCEAEEQKRVNDLECTGQNLCPDARHEIKRIMTTRVDGAPGFLLLYRVFYNKDKVVKTTAGKAFRRRGESKYEIPPKEIRELEHEKGEVDFEQEPVDLKYPADFDQRMISMFCDRVRESVNFTQPHSNEEILSRRRLGIVTAKGFQPNVACTLLFGIDPLIKFPGCKTRFLGTRQLLMHVFIVPTA